VATEDPQATQTVIRDLVPFLSGLDETSGVFYEEHKHVSVTDDADPQPRARRSRRTRSTAARRAVARMTRCRSRECGYAILYA